MVDLVSVLEIKLLRRWHISTYINYGDHWPNKTTGRVSVRHRFELIYSNPSFSQRGAWAAAEVSDRGLSST